MDGKTCNKASVQWLAHSGHGCLLYNSFNFALRLQCFLIKREEERLWSRGRDQRYVRPWPTGPILAEGGRAAETPLREGPGGDPGDSRAAPSQERKPAGASAALTPLLSHPHSSVRKSLVFRWGNRRPRGLSPHRNGQVRSLRGRRRVGFWDERTLRR